MTAWGRPSARVPSALSGRAISPATSSIAAAIFSAIPYKTPWNLLPFYVGAIVLAGIGFSTLVHATASRAVRGALAAALAIASGQLGWQAWRASVTYASDPRNPYVYAQTVPDAVRMATRIRELAAVHPDGARMQVSVIAPPHEQWPLPWYLRAMPHVGYWTAPGDALALQAPVIVASIGQRGRPRRRPRRSLRVGVLRPQARGAPGALRRARAVGALPGPGGAGRAGARVRRRGMHDIPALRTDTRCGTVADAERAMTPPELALVVPCYNEAARLDPEAFLHFVTTHPGVQLVMVDDGSLDGTGEILERIRAAAPAAVTTLRHSPQPGQGRGGARRHARGAGAARQRSSGSSTPTWPTPLRAIDDFLAVLRDRPAVEFVLGSRVMLMGRDIKRKATRHYLGRVFATAVSHALDLPVYDTQCGAKMLRVNAATATLFDTPFRSRVDLRRRADRAIPAAAGRARRARPPRSPVRAGPAGVARQARVEAALARLSRARWSSSDTFGASASRTSTRRS